MIKKIKSTIEKNKLISYNDKIVVGFSGGADSCCLLKILLKLKEIYNIEIIAVHINHLLRGDEAFEDENFSKSFCKSVGVKFYSFSEDVKGFASKNKISEEEAGRIIRYKYFNFVLEKEKANKISVAHSKNDQAETILMRIIRGTGVRGLSGIPYKNKNIIRPLLDVSRKEIENYCEHNKINFRIDSTNKKSLYSRNKLRHELLPYIKEEFNKNIIDTLNNLANLSKDEDSFLEKLALESFKECVEIGSNVSINIEKILLKDDVIKRRILRKSLENFNVSLKDISYVHIEDILALLKKESGKKINLPNNIFIYKEYSHLIISKDLKQTKNFCYELLFDKTIFISEINKYISISFEKIEFQKGLINVYTKKFSYDKIGNTLKLRTRLSGDKISLSAGTKKLKDFFIDKKVPATLREEIPLITDGSNIVSILDYIKKESYFYSKVELNEKVFFVQLWEDKE